nr:hypothetical protein [Tanacetum cinerariifolium]
MEGFKLGIGALTGATTGSETEAGDSGSVPDPEDEAILALTNLDIISVKELGKPELDLPEVDEVDLD